MKRFFVAKINFATLLFAGFLVVGILSGCSFSGLSSAGSGTSLTLSVSAPRLVSSSSRAVFSDSMVVYLRTVGGSSSSSGSLYGPYTLSSTKLTITDIPSGSYANMAIIGFASAPAQSLVDLLAAATDAEIVADDKTGTSLANFDTLCEGTAVVGMTGSVTLQAGSNSVAATLTPLCSSGSTVTANSDGLTTYAFTVVTGTSYRRFVKLDLSYFKDTSGWTNMSLSCGTINTETSLALYDASGKTLSGFSYTGFVDPDYWFGISPLTVPDCVYLYIKTTGEDADEGSFTLNFTAAQVS